MSKAISTQTRQRRIAIRQRVIFGIIITVLAVATVVSILMMVRVIPYPAANRPFTSPSAVAVNYGTVPCPVGDAPKFSPANDIGVRVMNSTSTAGLANTTSQDLRDRGFQVREPSDAPVFSEVALIRTGRSGINQAYTVARQLPEKGTHIVIDSREGTDVDLILGTEYQGLAPVIATDDLPIVPLPECKVIKDSTKLDPPPVERTKDPAKEEAPAV